MASHTSRLDRFLEASVVGSFTAIGHKVRSREWQPIANDALSDRTVVITGATSGIGKTVAMRAAACGARLRIVARTVDKVRSVREEIVAATGNANIRYYIADLSLMQQVSELSKDILANEPEIHVLINNAVVLPPERILTDEGLELAHATNLVAPFLLTNGLKERTVASAPARIINVISGGMYTQELHLDDLNSSEGEYSGSVAYARAKRGLMVLTKMWAEQLAGTGVTANATHPGWVDTPGVRDSLPMFHKLTRTLLRTPEQGSDTILWLATAADGEQESGKLWHDRTIRSEYKLKKTIETSAERNLLWDKLTKTVNRVLA